MLSRKLLLKNASHRRPPRQRQERRVGFYITIALLLGISVVAQPRCPLALQVWGVTPDLVLVVVAAAGLLQGSTVGAVTGFVGAYLLSSICPFSPGSIYVSYIVIGYLSGLVCFRAYTDHPLVSACTGFGAGIVSETLFYILNPKNGLVLLEGALARGAYAFVLTPLAYFLLRRFVDSIRSQEEGEW